MAFQSRSRISILQRALKHGGPTNLIVASSSHALGSWNACVFYSCTFLQNVKLTKWLFCVVTNDRQKPEELRLVQGCFIHVPTHYVGYYYQTKNIIIIILYYFVESSYRIVTWGLISSLLQSYINIFKFYSAYQLHFKSRDSKDVLFLTVVLLRCQVCSNVTPSRLVHIYQPTNSLQPSFLHYLRRCVAMWIKIQPV